MMAEALSIFISGGGNGGGSFPPKPAPLGKAL